MPLNPALIPAWTHGREGNRPRFILIHHWGIRGQRHENVVRYLTTNGRTDIHYVVSAGKVTPIVAETDTAWHAGDWDANVESIGIECRPECTPADFDEVARLIAQIRRRWGWLPLKGHKDVYNTTCPGLWYTRLDELSRRADQIAAGTTSPATPVARKKGKQMLMIALPKGRGNETLFAIFTSGFWLEFTGVEAANFFSKQVIGGTGAWIATPGFWDHCKRAAKAGQVDIDELARRIVDLQKEGV